MSADLFNNPETLDNLRPGDETTILDLKCTTDMLQQKLLSLGLVRSTTIKVTEIAPLGDPINILVRGVNLALRRSEARGVLVHPPVPS
jgi:ferrous iron transport protein A